MRRSVPVRTVRPDRSEEFASFVMPAARRATMTVPASVVSPVEKFEYVRDERLRDMCRAMPCQHCGRSGPDAGVTWAHSNWAEHGKGKSVKASDVFVAALCWRCHSELDQGMRWSQSEKERIWNDAHLLTIRTAIRMRLWPKGLALPPTAQSIALEPA